MKSHTISGAKAVIIAALIGGGVSLLAVAITFVVEERKLTQTNQLQRMEEKVAVALLQERPYRWRSFDIIKYHLGLDDNAVREVLLRVGAVRWETENGEEVWGLLDEDHACWLSWKGIPGKLNDGILIPPCPTEAADGGRTGAEHSSQPTDSPR